MGVFDNVRCEYPLPVSGFEGRVFQTKDFDEPFLNDYTITADGRLIVYATNYEDVPEEERPGYAEYLATGSRVSLFLGCIRPAPPFNQDVNYHGDLQFYDFASENDSKSPLVIFEARFTHGQLESIRVVEG